MNDEIKQRMDYLLTTEHGVLKLMTVCRNRPEFLVALAEIHGANWEQALTQLRLELATVAGVYVCLLIEKEKVANVELSGSTASSASPVPAPC